MPPKTLKRYKFRFYRFHARTRKLQSIDEFKTRPVTKTRFKKLLKTQIAKQAAWSGYFGYQVLEGVRGDS